MQRVVLRPDGINTHNMTTDKPTGDIWVILNPVSGTGDHADRVRCWAAKRDHTIYETQEEGDACTLAKATPIGDIDVVVACGGDGTVNGVARGLLEADALSSVTLGVLPAGTANRFAADIGIESLNHGFDVLDTGETRRLDLGIAGEEVFVLSCIAGLTAEATKAANPELKERFGRLAFAVAGLEEAATFDPLNVALTGDSDGGELYWDGAALGVFVGNSRRFANEGGQANIEDGQLDVTIVEDMPPLDIIVEWAAHRLFGRDTEHVIQTTTERLTINSNSDEPIVFSLDGEIRTYDRLSLSIRRGAFEVYVGPTYDPAGH